jgi:hypothetical protein
VNWVIVPYICNWEATESALQDCLAQILPDIRLLFINNGAESIPKVWLHHPQVAYWRHYPPMLSLSATWNRALGFVWETGEDHALVINNDVRMWAGTYNYLLRTVQETRALFVTATGVTLPQYEAFLASDPNPEVGLPTYPLPGPDFSCFLITKEGHTKYPFDEGYQPAFCVTPETLVLTKDLHWVPIGGLHAGDWLLGVDEHSGLRGKGEHYRRRYLPSQITSVHRRLAPCLRLQMSDGRTVTCSRDHKWLTKTRHEGSPYEWRSAETLRVGWSISTPLDPWKPPSTYTEGWLAGIIDGEGCLRQTGRNKFELNISQKPGVVLDRIHTLLREVGIPFTGRIRPENGVAIVEIGIRRHVFQALGQLRPRRLLAGLEWDDVCTFSRSLPMGLLIENITDAGTQEVVTVETSTKTYIANGMIAHNCEDLDMHRRYMLDGDGQRIFGTGLPYYHIGSSTLKTLPEDKREALQRRIEQGSRAYHLRKWGGPANQERLTVPFDLSSARDGVTTPELFERVRNGQTAL